MKEIVKTPPRPRQPEPECVILKGGRCSTHCLQAKKSIKIVKEWKKLKSGLFGNAYSRRTTYECGGKLKTGETNPNPGPSVSSNASGEVGRLLSGSYLGIRGRTSEQMSEPTD